ncbi:hypothetical protein INT45_014079 [Circinella minor]|uniref:RRM domain-containing protein n=1 Tax=Circinella minor TaxID=1195481 RepID=A0A8H7RZB1_9FUNG|nr:hypothetical protein INT45_014079 [Circinella minor]
MYMALPDSHQKPPGRPEVINHTFSPYTSSPTVLTSAKITQPEQANASIFEINLRADDERKRVIEQGITFTKEITICATPALDKSSQVKKFCLSHLPLLDPEDLEQGLRNTFAPYGRVLDVGINRDPKTKAYMANVFAVLDIQSRPQQKNKARGHYIP